MQDATPHVSIQALLQSRWLQAPATLALMALSAAIYLAMGLQGDALHTPSALALYWGANFGPATQVGEWWRLLSAIFVHLSLLHVVVNLWALWDIGRLVERLIGRLRFVALFLAAGVVGNLVSLAMQSQARVSGGTSGAIFGLYGVLIAFLWRERKRIASDEYRWIFRVATLLPALMLVLGYFIPAIDNAAHAGGFAAGLLLGVVMLPPALPAIPARTASWSAAVLCGFAVFALLASLPQPAYHYADELRAQGAIRAFLDQDRVIRERWNTLVQAYSTQSFEQVAGALHTEVALPYQESFEALAALDLQSAVPSKYTLLQLQAYAAMRQAQAQQEADAYTANQAWASTRASPQRKGVESSPR